MNIEFEIYDNKGSFIDIRKIELFKINSISSIYIPLLFPNDQLDKIVDLYFRYNFVKVSYTTKALERICFDFDN